MAFNTPPLPIYVGCPVWNCDAWGGTVYPEGTKRGEWLAWYSRMFNCVEGNSSFYGIPRLDQVARWGAESADGFRFCFKFPREISHERGLVHAEEATQAFLQVIEVLAKAERLGTTFLQLGPEFAADRLDLLSRYLQALPKEFPWAVEVRHGSWFDEATNEQRLNDLLSRLQIDRVIFDSRPLYQAPADDEIERESQRRKPRSPIRTTVTGRAPFLRLIGRNRIEMVDAYIDEWSSTICQWLQSGYRPYIFTHAPDDRFAPELARRLWDRLRSTLDLTPTPASLPRLPAKPRQLELF